jgi:hypothetical protein
LVALARRAVAAMGEALSADADPRLRLRAADLVLQRLLQLRELLSLEARIAALERREREREEAEHGRR